MNASVGVRDGFGAQAFSDIDNGQDDGLPPQTFDERFSKHQAVYGGQCREGDEPKHRRLNRRWGQWMDESNGQEPIQHNRAELQTIECTRDKRWSSYVNRAALQEPHALADSYDESSRLIFSIASRILGNPADAEEITLDVFTYVWRSAAQFDSSRASVATWLVMLTRSRAIDRLRTISLRTDQSGTNRSHNLHCTPVALKSDDSSHVFVVRVLEQLESADRELLEHVFYSGLSHSELAIKLEIPLGTVKSRVRAALGRVRKLMGEEG
jgi:RNA polymerase sigma-70 factor (ECF subfamily)